MVQISTKTSSKLLSVTLLLAAVHYLSAGVSTKAQQPFFASPLIDRPRSSLPYHQYYQQHHLVRIALPPSVGAPCPAQRRREGRRRKRAANLFAEFGNGDRQDRTGPNMPRQAKGVTREEKAAVVDPRLPEPPPPPPREDEPVARPFANWLRVAKRFSTDVKDPPSGGLKGVLWAFGSTFLEASLLILAVVVAAAMISFLVYSTFDRDFSNTFNPDIWYGS